jgi:hypothetical protein
MLLLSCIDEEESLAGPAGLTFRLAWLGSASAVLRSLNVVELAQDGSEQCGRLLTKQTDFMDDHPPKLRCFLISNVHPVKPSRATALTDGDHKIRTCPR